MIGLRLNRRNKPNTTTRSTSRSLSLFSSQCHPPLNSLHSRPPRGYHQKPEKHLAPATRSMYYSDSRPNNPTMSTSSIYPELYQATAPEEPASNFSGSTFLPPVLDAFDTGHLNLQRATAFCSSIEELLLTPAAKPISEPSSSYLGTWDSSPGNNFKPSRTVHHYHHGAAAPVFITQPPVQQQTTVVNNYGPTTGVGNVSTSSESVTDKTSSNPNKKKDDESDQKQAAVAKKKEDEISFGQHMMAAAVVAVAVPVTLWLVKDDVNRWRLFHDTDRQYELLKASVKAFSKSVSTSPGVVSSSPNRSLRTDRLEEVLIQWKVVRAIVYSDLRSQVGTKAGIGAGSVGTAVAIVMGSVWGLWGGALLLGGSAAWRIYKSSVKDRSRERQLEDLKQAVRLFMQ